MFGTDKEGKKNYVDRKNVLAKREKHSTAKQIVNNLFIFRNLVEFSQEAASIL